MDLQELYDEIVADPFALGYVVGGNWIGDQAIADIMNDNTNGGASDVRRTSVPMKEIFAEVVWPDFITLSAERQNCFKLITSTSVLDASSPNIIDAFVAIFGAGSETLTALNALTLKVGSRGEVLWGEGTQVTASQVARAENLS